MALAGALFGLGAATATETPADGASLVSAADARYSFTHPPFVHPRIIEDLSTWISDSGDQVVAINLLDAQGSNRYFGDIHTYGSCHPFVYSAREDGGRFGYRYVGMTASGVHVLHVSDSGGGSSVFNWLTLLAIQRDLGVDCCEWDGRAATVHANRPRLLLEKLGEITLGDRWSGALRISGNALIVGEDKGNLMPSRGAGTPGSGTHALTIALRPEAPLDFARHGEPCDAAR